MKLKQEKEIGIPGGKQGSRRRQVSKIGVDKRTVKRTSNATFKASIIPFSSMIA